MKDEMQKLVREGYNSGRYGEIYRNRTSLTDFERRLFETIVSLLKTDGHILDLGSGPGIPYDSYLISQGFDVTGIDLSEKHVAESKRNVPEAYYILDDFSRREIEMDKYSCIIALYSIIHLPRELHSNLLREIYTALPKGGLLLITMGTKDTSYKERDYFCDSKMAWSFFSTEINVEMIENCGFLIIESKNEKDYGSDESHIWILAQK